MQVKIYHWKMENCAVLTSDSSHTHTHIHTFESTRSLSLKRSRNEYSVRGATIIIYCLGCVYVVRQGVNRQEKSKIYRQSALHCSRMHDCRAVDETYTKDSRSFNRVGESLVGGWGILGASERRWQLAREAVWTRSGKFWWLSQIRLIVFL